jgi:uncharacterized membrane protein YhdT
MREKTGILWNRIFFVLFCILTLLCWCPVGYGSYGAVDRLAGMPDWTAYALIISVVLFILEWIYLFQSGLTVNDQDLPDIFAELQKTIQGESESGKGGA